MTWQAQSLWGQQNLGSQDLQFGTSTNSTGTGVSGAGSLDPSNSGFSLGWNTPTLQMGLQGLNTLGNIWGAWQSNKLAKDQLNFTKEITNTNLNNQIKSYNTSLEDRSRSRAAVEGQSDTEAQAYIDKNKLTRG